MALNKSLFHHTPRATWLRQCSTASYLPHTPTVVGNRVYFTALDSEHGLELWQSDGTTAGTGLFYDLLPGPGSSYPSQVLAAGSRLYVTTYADGWTLASGTERNKLWSFDLSATTLANLSASWSNLQITCKQAAAVRCKLSGQLRVHGSVTAPTNTNVAFYLSADALLDSNDLPLGKPRKVAKLSAGTEKTVKVKLKLPVGTSATGQYILAQVDPGNTISESNETDNVVAWGPLN